MSITVRLWTEEDLENTKSDPLLATVLGNVTTYSLESMRAYSRLTFKVYEVYFKGDPEAHHVKAIDDLSLFWFLEQEYYTDEILEIYELDPAERKLSLDTLVRHPRFTMRGYATIYH